jgi:hypothetical protein
MASGFNIDQIPGDVARFVHGAQFGHGLGRGFIIDDVDAGLFHVRRVIGVLLRCGIGAAPAYDCHFVGHVTIRERHGGGQRQARCCHQFHCGFHR